MRHDAYHAARLRFVDRETEIDGHPYRLREDPVTGLRLAVPREFASMLGWLFRGHWLTHAPSRSE